MCLNKVDKILKPIDWTERTAWKVFRPIPEGYQFEFQGLRGSPEVPTGKWLKAKVSDLRSWGYKSGFHAFTTREGARVWRGYPYDGYAIVKVKVRGVQTLGSQCGHECLVAREMLVPPRGKARK